MAVTIRLQRFGAKKRPYYRVVVADSRVKRDGRFLEQVGTYDPMQDPPKVTFNSERIGYWSSVGAQKSETVAKLFHAFEAAQNTTASNG